MDTSQKETEDKTETMETDKDSSSSTSDVNSGTFKTPSFVIPSKKKVQSSPQTSEAFKSPPVPIKPTSKKSEQEKPSTDEETAQLVNNEQNPSISDIKHPKEESVKIPTASSKKVQSLSPAEQLKLAQASIPYKAPAWSGICEEKFSFEIIKNGAVIENIDLTKQAYHVIGRLPSCDIPMEHPSLSRYHAVVQYSNGSSDQYPSGWYLYDLDSTHGTWINKNKVPSQKYHRLHVDYVLKFGGSTRLFILQGPDTDREDESELSATEMKEQREKHLKEAELLRQAEIEEAERKAELIKKREESKGCSWGIDEDEIEEEDDNAENPFASIEPENEALYINDPKKSLNGYFEREGLELPEYEFHEAGFGKWKCTIELPIDAPNGEPIVAEVVVSGKKREAVIACALEACRILDRHGELRKSAQESRKRKQRNWEEDDFYDSDDDVYLDRTGAIEKKRALRKEKIGKKEKDAETYESLLEKHKNIVTEIEEIETKLEQAKQQAAAMDNEEVDALDAYMNAIKSGMMDTKTKMKFKRQVMELKQEEQKLRKLVNIAKPASLPELKPVDTDTKTVGKKLSLLSNTGKIKGRLPSNKPQNVLHGKKTVSVEKQTMESTENVEEYEEEEDQVNISEDIHSDKGVKDVRTGDSDAYNSKGANVKESDRNKPQDVSEAKGDKISEKSKETEVKPKPIRQSKGHSLPLAAVLEQLQGEIDDNDDDDDKGDGDRTGNFGNKNMKTKHQKKKLKSDDGGYRVEDPDYAVWLPPKNQTGDGRTHLNEKLGY
ncbi:Kanadaptin [Mactra antiquata]